MSLLASLGFLVATILVYSLLLAPSYREVNRLRGDLAARRALVEDQKKVAGQVQELLTKYESVAGLQDRISRVLPAKEDYPSIINQIRGLAEVSQLTLESVNINALPAVRGAAIQPGETTLLPPGTLQADISVNGSYGALKNFLTSLERNIRIMDVVDVAMNPGTGQNFSAKLVVKTYYQSL